MIFRSYVVKAKLNEELARTNGELKRVNEELESKNAELKRLNEEVLELTHSRLVFFTNISHELRKLCHAVRIVQYTLLCLCQS